MNRKNIKIFYVLAFLQGLVFYSSVATLYRTTNGITLLEMGIIESFFSVFMIVLELPWGFVCDRIGYKKTMIIANGFYFLSKVVFWQANGFASFLLERLLLAISVSGLSGCDSSLLYLSTTQDEATGVYGKQSMYGVWGMVIASTSFTFVFKGNMRYAVFATVISHFLAFVLTLFLDDIEETQEKQLTLKGVFKALLKNRSIILVLIASVLLTDTTHTLTVFYNQLQYERVGIPIKYYGIIFISLQLVSMSCGLIGNITKYISKERMACILFGVAAISSLGLIVSKGMYSSIVLLMILTCIECMYAPIYTTIESESVDAGARASMISIYSLIMEGLTAFTSLSFGKAANNSLQSAYWLAFVFCMIGLLLFLIWDKCKRFKVLPVGK